MSARKKEFDLNLSNTTFCGRIIRYVDQLESKEVANLTVSMLSRKLEINRSVLYKKFIKEIGKTPGEYLVEARQHSILASEERKNIPMQVVRYVEALPREQLATLSVGIIARKFDVSSSYLARAFKLEMRSSLSQFILRTKIDRGERLSRDDGIS
jgi:AraC-like DNA-binding protein